MNDNDTVMAVVIVLCITFILWILISTTFDYNKLKLGVTSNQYKILVVEKGEYNKLVNRYKEVK